jgi:acyl-CoA hydrolase
MTVRSDWASDYRKRLMAPEKAVLLFKDGQRIAIPTIAGEPPALVRALGQAAERGTAARLTMSSILPGSYTSAHLLKPACRERIHWDSWFCGGGDRDAVFAGIYDMTPMHFGQLPHVLKRDRPYDGVITVVSPPDEEGYVTPSFAVDYTKALVETGTIKIAEVNPNVPRVYGDCRLHVSLFDAIVESDDPIMELTTPPMTAEDEAIGRFIAERIPDGATVQIGFGGVPSAVGLAHRDHKHLGVHTEMFGDALRVLMERGVVDNSRKTLNPGVSVYTFCVATKETYRFLHENPDISAHPVDYTNDPQVIAQHDDMISVNGTIMIDLTGQACSESIGPKQYSGTGGQVDFVRGAVMAKGGRSFIAAYATAIDGETSRIVDMLPPGAVVTTPRTDIDCFVTEYGVAQLRGKSLRERAQALIAVAHPKFRDELQRQARARGLGPR